MTKCNSCQNNLRQYTKKLQSDEPLRYCPFCGKMLVQKCPYSNCNMDLGEDSILSCSECGNEIVFCEGAGCEKVHVYSDDVCDVCDTPLKKHENIFMSNCVNYGRTNVYKPAEFTTNTIPRNIEVESNFSVTTVRNGKIFCWVETQYTASILTAYNIFSDSPTRSSTGDEQNIIYSDIKDIEIFGEYIISTTKSNIYIHYHASLDLLHIIPVTILTESESQIIKYKVAVLDDFILVVLTTGQGEEVVSIDISNIHRGKISKSIMRHASSEREHCILNNKASPAVLNNAYAFFAGDAGCVYKFCLINDRTEAELTSLQIDFPEEAVNHCINQITAINENKILLVDQSGNTFSLFEMRGDKFGFVGSITNLMQDRISFLSDDIFMFVKNNENDKGYSYARSTKETWENTGDKLEFLTPQISGIRENCVVLLDNSPHIVYLVKDNSHFAIKTQACNQGGIVKTRHSIDTVLEPRFQIYGNYLIVYENRDHNKKIEFIHL